MCYGRARQRARLQDNGAVEIQPLSRRQEVKAIGEAESFDGTELRWSLPDFANYLDRMRTKGATPAPTAAGCQPRPGSAGGAPVGLAPEYPCMTISGTNPRYRRRAGAEGVRCDIRRYDKKGDLLV